MYRLIVIVFILVVATGFLTSLYFQQHDAEEEPSTALVKKKVPARKIEEPVIRHPIPEVQPPVKTEAIEKTAPVAEQAEPEPLPALENSDDAVLALLDGLYGQQRTRELLNVDNLIQRFVITVDNITRSKLPLKYLSTKAVTGQFLTTPQQTGDEAIFIKPDNYQRYMPYIVFIEALEVDSIVPIYIHLYPLIQQAYVSQGYPSAYFNDRLIEALDHLLETPEAREPVELIRPSVMYQYADPGLEALSAGQKILIRIGNDNAQRLKVKILELRHALADNKTE